MFPDYMSKDKSKEGKRNSIKPIPLSNLLLMSETGSVSADGMNSSDNVPDIARNSTPRESININQVNLNEVNTAEQEPDTGTVKHSTVAIKPKRPGLTKYTIYVTSKRMYIVGSNTRETVFRILEIDFTDPEKLVVMEDNVYFNRTEIMDVLNGLEDSSDNGLTKKVTAVGLLGFIRFTKYYYLLVITKRKPAAILGGHYIYHVDDTELIPVTHNPKKPPRNSEEARFLHTFLSIDLGKTFYFSYTYDLTNTLQKNVVRFKKKFLGLYETNNQRSNTSTPQIKTTEENIGDFRYNDRFVWNSHLLEPVLRTFDRVYDWFQPIMHGFVDQIKLSIFGSDVYITLIARRSHHFAGARFFKRGVNDSGNVANEVETEQIVSDMLTSSFHDPKAGFFNNPRYTSFVQHRGSIPLSWSQATVPNIRMTKPPIELNVIDPFYSAAALHFDDLFKRYGAPIQILNLIKQKEKSPRETKLLREFGNCVDYLNKFLPDDKKIIYTAWDMSRASKSHGQDVIAWLECYSEKTLQITGFFHNGRTLNDTKLQHGVCRTNCIDCLDRTNAAQFVIGKRALGHQLKALGYTKNIYLEYDSDAINSWTELFHDHGDTIAMQYGGSHLVNTLQTYRKINQWSSHSRDMIESVKRFYSNSFIDAQRQDAINLFLGNYVYKEGHPMLWDLNTDYYLHNNYLGISLNYRPSYTHWYTDSNLIDRKQELMHLQEEIKGPLFDQLERMTVLRIDPYPGFFDNYWNNKYPARILSSFEDSFEYNMNSTLHYTNRRAIVSGLGNGAHLETPMKDTTTEKEPTTSDNGQSTCESDVKSIYSSSVYSLELELQNGADKKYVSPFKSRKPRREELLDERLQEEEAKWNAKGDLICMDESKESAPLSNPVTTENEYYFGLAALKNSYEKYKRVEKSHGYLSEMLEKTNDEINAMIDDTRTLPIITGPSSQILNEDAFDYIDEGYMKGNDVTSEKADGSMLERFEKLYHLSAPKVYEKNLKIYENSISSVKMHYDEAFREKTEKLMSDYKGVLRVEISNEDLGMYRQFVDCMNEWKVERDIEDRTKWEVVSETDEEEEEDEEEDDGDISSQASSFGTLGESIDSQESVQYKNATLNKNTEKDTVLESAKRDIGENLDNLDGQIDDNDVTVEQVRESKIENATTKDENIVAVSDENEPSYFSFKEPKQHLGTENTDHNDRDGKLEKKDQRQELPENEADTILDGSEKSEDFSTTMVGGLHNDKATAGSPFQDDK